MPSGEKLWDAILFYVCVLDGIKGCYKGPSQTLALKSKSKEACTFTTDPVALAQGIDLGSDHFPVCCTLGVVPVRLPMGAAQHWKIGAADWTKWTSHMNAHTDQTHVGLCNAIISKDFLLGAINSVTEKSVPMSTGRTGISRATSWWDAVCSTAVAQHRHANEQLFCCSSQENVIKYKCLEMVAKRTILLKKRNTLAQYVGALTYSTRSASVWRCIQSISGRCLRLQFNLKNVLGGGDYSSRVQLCITRVLAKFLSTVGRSVIILKVTVKIKKGILCFWKWRVLKELLPHTWVLLPIMVGEDDISSLPSEVPASFHSMSSAPFGPQLPLQLVAASSGVPAEDSDVLLSSTTQSPHFTEVIVNSLLSMYNKMVYSASENGSCHADCSGRGECLNGTCFCSVQYEGESCNDPNVAYFASFSCIFFFIAAISLGQLIVCIRAEYKRLKAPTLRKACCITTQKMLYFITFVAAAIRGAYFSSPSNAELTLASSFLSSFYPMILSGGSLIVCFWAEAFHLRNIRCERPRFLSKSFLGFLTFNVITYSLFVAEVFLQRDSPTEEERRFLAHIFNGCYAVLMFIMVVFFLIYGVEVYFKVRGGFVNDSLVVGTLHSRQPSTANSDATTALRGDSDVEAKSATCTGLCKQQGSSSSASNTSRCDQEQDINKCASLVSKTEDQITASQDDDKVDQERSLEPLLLHKCSCAERANKSSCTGPLPSTSDNHAAACERLLTPPELRVAGSRLDISGGTERGIDYSQLSQSRFGLVFQACMLMITVCFLFSDVLGGFWKNRVPLISRNAYDILFRVVELGVAMWFPCVLWNCIAPEQLWILNPKKILKKIDIDKSVEVTTPEAGGGEGEVDSSSESSPPRECWICYDTTANTETGPMIEPCLCSGDVASVHHNCLRKWLIECAQNNNTDQLACKVCQAEYELERSPNWWIGQGFTSRHWLHTASLVTVMCGTIAAAWAVLQVYQDALIRSLTVGAMLLIIYVCLRFLGFNTFTAYRRARYSAVKILSRHFSGPASVNASSTTTENVSSSPSHSMSSVCTDTSDLSDGHVATISGTLSVTNDHLTTSEDRPATVAGGQVTLDISASAVRA
ncbi:Zinc finger RING-CH-type [Trinorchestia longiramus]|nr:Zinc finger RING-CH-type [Trinorchestia longiramus]